MTTVEPATRPRIWVMVLDPMLPHVGSGKRGAEGGGDDGNV
jgi:hypothetical protein